MSRGARTLFLVVGVVVVGSRRPRLRQSVALRLPDHSLPRRVWLDFYELFHAGLWPQDCVPLKQLCENVEKLFRYRLPRTDLVRMSGGAEISTETGKNFFRRMGDKLNCRQVLNIMVFFGFMVNYMLRVNLTIAIVDMVTQVQIGNSSIGQITTDDNETTAVEVSSATTETVDEKFPWDAYQQNLILGSFFWGYICTELPGGRLAEVIGARRVWGFSILIASIVTLFTPLAASLGYIAVVALRVIIGFMLGVTFPAIQPLAAKWIPPMDRTKFISNMMASSLGAAITLPVCGFLIATLGWASVFYVTGIVGLIWSVAWFLLVFDTPGQHPRITKAERDFIEDAIGISSKSRKAHKVPWMKIFSSAPVWAIVVTHGASVFCYFTVVNQLPTYMKYILQFNIKENGFFSSFPYLGKYIMALITSYIADWLRSSGKLSTTATRKLFTFFAVGLPGVLMVLQVFMGNNAAWCIAIFTIALTLNGAVTAGYLGNGLDIAPNFCGTIFGMANTLSSIGGFVSAWMVGYLTYENQTYFQWQIVFWVLAGTYLIGSVVFLIFGTGELQEWNSPESERMNSHNEVELGEKEALKTDNS